MFGWRSEHVTSISRMKISCAPSSITIRGSMTLRATLSGPAFPAPALGGAPARRCAR